MKKLPTVSLLIFLSAVIIIFILGFLFYKDEEKKTDIVDNKSLVTVETVNLVVNNETKNEVNQNTKIVNKPILDLKEVSLHNKIMDCWVVINNKVYNITDYFGSHPGGDDTMLPVCGADATDEYKTRDPYATSSKNRTKHSTKAQNMLNDYYVGEFQNI